MAEQANETVSGKRVAVHFDAMEVYGCLHGAEIEGFAVLNSIGEAEFDLFAGGVFLVGELIELEVDEHLKL